MDSQTQETPPLDEAALRRPDFAGGRAVTLADGQAWYFPCPEIDLSPVALDNGTIDVETETTFGPQFDQLVREVSNAETAREEAIALLRLAVNLLRRNYDVADSDLRRLLRYRVSSDAEANDALDAIYRVAIGAAPKV